jgi:hypothetical protein
MVVIIGGSRLAWAQAPGGQQPAAAAEVNSLPSTTFPTVVAGYVDGRFGIARIRLRPPLLGLESGDVVHVDSNQRRALYPAFREVQVDRQAVRPLPPPAERRIGGGRLLRRLAQVLDSATGAEGNDHEVVAVEILFLFREYEPFEISISGPVNQQLRLEPQPLSPREYQSLLWQWWDAYQSDARRRIRSADYPPIVETYLSAMLSGRLGLDSFRGDFADPAPVTSPLSTLALLAGAEALRIEAVRTASVGPPVDPPAAANLPLPEPISWAPPTPPPGSAGPAEVEEIAGRVPEDCFYLRFGPFSNFLWFQNLAAEYGGDIAQMALQRGVNFDVNRRIEQRLNLRYTTMARLFGDAVIGDMVIAGDDMFFVEGASFGVVFKASNPLLLSLSLTQERTATQRAVSGCTLTNETIAGRSVSLLNTPDQSVRSFMVQEGPWFFVTSSRSLMERFLKVIDGAPSLADDPQFRFCRTQMSQTDGQTIFAFFSTRFFQQLIQPRTQIELRRRMAAAAELSVLRMAQLAAQVESSPAHEIDELIEAGYLPAGFGNRPDGSGLIVAGDVAFDSMRGQRGAFLPISDTPVDRVTPAETAWYETVRDYYSSQWRQFDPLAVSMRRSTISGSENRELIEFHAEVAPIVSEKYGWIARQLGPPTNLAIRPAPDDVAFAQAHVAPELLSTIVPAHHLFAGVKDMVPPSQQQLMSALRVFFALRILPAYLGAWPQPGVLDQLPLRLGQGQPISPEISRLIGGLFRYQANGFSVLSFSAELLANSAPYWAPIEVDDQAQVRVLIREILDTRLERWVAERMFERSFASSLAGARLLDALDSQLGVPEERADEEAERLIGGRLVCPLGGTYELAPIGERQRWRSSAWGRLGGLGKSPEDYTPPLLKWFRGLDARLMQSNDRLVLHGSLEIQRQPAVASPAIESPSSANPPAEDTGR